MSGRMSKKMFALLMMAGVLSLSACSDNGGDEQNAAENSTQQMNNAMDVKQPEPSAAPKAPLAEEVPEVKTQASVPEIKPASKPEPVEETVAAEPEPASAPAEETATAGVSGEKVYATCVGCHGAAGEGGVGPKLAGQAVTDVVDKLQRYKAGEQVGPMTGMMAPMAAGLSEDDMQAVAEYVNGL